MHMLCLETDCNHRIVVLKHFNNVGRYVEHLKSHSDDFDEDCFSAVMLKRLENSYIFTTHQELSTLTKMAPFNCPGPVTILPSLQQQIADCSVERDFNGHYLSNWLRVILCEGGLFQSTSALYQEIDALISTVFAYPGKIHDWSIYQTLSLHAMAVYTSTSLQSYELLRGWHFFLPPRTSGERLAALQALGLMVICNKFTP